MIPKVFFRCDDIGPWSPRATRFIDLMEELGQPYLLAVIPDALNFLTTRRLRRTRHAMLLQHGFDHRNHASAEAPDEFPDDAGVAVIERRLRDGRRKLADALGREVTGYCPPWNRVSSTALRSLEAQGYTLLSANAEHSTTLQQLHIQVDVYASYEPVEVRSNAEIQAEIDALMVNATRVGVMLHPLSTPRSQMARLQQLIRDNTDQASKLEC